jgi:hypothetical protein
MRRSRKRGGNPGKESKNKVNMLSNRLSALQNQRRAAIAKYRHQMENASHDNFQPQSYSPTVLNNYVKIPVNRTKPFKVMVPANQENAVKKAQKNAAKKAQENAEKAQYAEMEEEAKLAMLRKTQKNITNIQLKQEQFRQAVEQMYKNRGV